MKHEHSQQFEHSERAKKLDDPYGQKFGGLTSPIEAIRLYGAPNLLNHAFPCQNGFVVIGFQNEPCRAIFPLGRQSKEGFQRFHGRHDLVETGNPHRPHELPVMCRLGAFRDWISYAQEWVRTAVDGQPARWA